MIRRKTDKFYNKYKDFIHSKNHEAMAKVINNLIKTKYYEDWELPLVNKHPTYQSEKDLGWLVVGPCIDEQANSLLQTDKAFQNLIALDKYLKDLRKVNPNITNLHERQQIGRIALKIINRSLTKEKYEAILNKKHPIFSFYDYFENKVTKGSSALQHKL